MKRGTIEHDAILGTRGHALLAAQLVILDAIRSFAYPGTVRVLAHALTSSDPRKLFASELHGLRFSRSLVAIVCEPA